MTKSSSDELLDDLDKTILQILQEEGRISNVDLASRVSLSPPAAYARTRRLEQRGFIRQYVTLLDREKLGYDMICFIQVGLGIHQFEQINDFRQAIQEIPEVLECHHLTGEYDYLIKVVVRNRKDLEQFVLNRLTPISGVTRIYTSVVLTEVKSSIAIPITFNSEET